MEMIFLKRFFVSVLILVLLTGTVFVTGTFAGDTVRIYTESGKSANVYSREVDTYMKLGWYIKPVKRLYAVDGRSAVFYDDDVAAQLKVGWYIKPVKMLYALDGRSVVFYEEDVAAQLKVGWYIKPVQALYASDGRIQVFYKEDVPAQLMVGWYTTPEAANAASKKSAYDVPDYKNEYAYTLKQRMNSADLSSNARFSLVYINNDNIPELIIHTGPAHASCVEIYTFYNGRAVYLGEFSSNGSLYYYYKRNRFVSLYVGMGTEVADVYNISGNKAVREVALTATYALNYSEDHTYSVCKVNGKKVSESKYIDTKVAYGMAECDLGYYSYTMYDNAYPLSSYNINRILG